LCAKANADPVQLPTFARFGGASVPWPRTATAAILNTALADFCEYMPRV